MKLINKCADRVQKQNSRPCDVIIWLVEVAKVEMGVVFPLCSENGKNLKNIDTKSKLNYMNYMMISKDSIM